MKAIRLIVLTLLIGMGVAVTYFYFEAIVQHAISFIWDDLFNTDENRLLVVPLCILLTTAYFGAQHIFDKKSEASTSEGLGAMPSPTIGNFIKVLGLGFLSLVAGASLGPEAVLVPACMILSAYIGKLQHGGPTSNKTFITLGFATLMTAFFDSFFIGLASLLLAKAQFGIALSRKLVALVALGCAACQLSLHALQSDAYVTTPDLSTHVTFSSLFVLVALVGAGYAMGYGLTGIHRYVERIAKPLKGRAWWIRALLAGAGLSGLYLVGGSLVQFTGNESIVPMLNQSAQLGLVGLLWIGVVKLAAISWSNVTGYRGGLIFPTVFAASVVVAIAQLYVPDTNFIYGLLCVLVGTFIANSKTKVLF